MATLQDVWESDHPEPYHGIRYTFRPEGEEPFYLVARCHYSFETNTRYTSYFIPDPNQWLRVFVGLVEDPEFACTKANEAGARALRIADPNLGIPERASSQLVFAKRMYVYVERPISVDERRLLLTMAADRGLTVELRDETWIRAHNNSLKPRGFLSHDSRDKEDVARPLAIELARLSCPVWFDEYSLRIGDSLTESIDRGIREASKCIVVLSPCFFANEGWSRAEFQSIMNRQINEGAVVLPVWHGVTRADVYGYSSFLVDTFAANTDTGMDRVAMDIALILKLDEQRDQK